VRTTQSVERVSHGGTENTEGGEGLMRSKTSVTA
jgi:hypothetical protein